MEVSIMTTVSLVVSTATTANVLNALPTSGAPRWAWVVDTQILPAIASGAASTFADVPVTNTPAVAGTSTTGVASGTVAFVLTGTTQYWSYTAGLAAGTVLLIRGFAAGELGKVA
jgi:hypothetical protein